MPMEVQAKLLLAIESRVTRRVGATRTTPTDVRLVCATHRDLKEQIRRGQFREWDFYYRIKGLTLVIPPLRERRDEIEGLIAQFAHARARSLGRDRPPAFDADARTALHRHRWPGNIRELRDVIETAVLLTEDGAVTPQILIEAGLRAEGLAAHAVSPEAAERERVIAALARCGGNQSRAARMLGVARNTLIRLIRKHDLRRPRAPAQDTSAVAPGDPDLDPSHIDPPLDDPP